MQKIVLVKLDDAKIYYFLQKNDTYNVGDKVVVEVDSAQHLATVVSINDKISQADFDEPLKEIIRKATAADLKKYEEMQDKAKYATKTTRNLAKKLKLDMKIVDSLYALDGSKVIITFSAEDRVDFRELLKELASSLRARIELKQIGQRDEVKIKGGIGPCGEVCCCKRFLNSFEHVTVKMAKNQGLSLSPTKISGLCGRLMCCLGYENPLYEQILAKMPKINSNVVTPDGEGQVIYNDILRESVSVKFVNGDDTNIVVYPLADIKFEKKKGDK